MMKARLQQLLNKEQLTPVRFAELVGVQRSSVSHILSGRNNPSLDFIQKILLKIPHISSDWLINGIGEMYRDHIESPETKTAELFAQSNEEDQVPYGTKSGLIGAVNQENRSNQRTDKPETGFIEPATSHSKTKIDTPSEIERIVVFYRDQTFREYKPE